MTVEKLIKELRKHPPKSQVAWSDHDQSRGEINCIVGWVEEFDPEKSFDPKFCKKVRVVLRP